MFPNFTSEIINYRHSYVRANTTSEDKDTLLHNYVLDEVQDNDNDNEIYNLTDKKYIFRCGNFNRTW